MWSVVNWSLRINCCNDETECTRSSWSDYFTENLWMSSVKISKEKPCENITCIMSEVFINLSLGEWGASNISRTVLNSGYFGYFIQWADHCSSCKNWCHQPEGQCDKCGRIYVFCNISRVIMSQRVFSHPYVKLPSVTAQKPWYAYQ